MTDIAIQHLPLKYAILFALYFSRKDTTMYRYLLFDIDDTLLDFQKAQMRAFQQVLKHHNISFSDDLYQSYQTINHNFWHAYEEGQYTKEAVLSGRFEHFFNTVGLKVNGHECDTLYRHHLAQGNQLYPHTLAVVRHFSKTHTLAIVTNGVAQTQLTRLENNQLLDYFSPNIFISDSVGSQKPDKHFFEYVYQKMNIKNPKEALIIGDSLHADIYGGHNAGMDTCWIKHPHTPHSANVTPTYTITDLKSLLDLNI